MKGGRRVKLTAISGDVIIIGTLKYSDENVYIVKDDYGHEGIYATRSYTLEDWQ